MKINDILSHIDSGYMALPEFQRGYTWNGNQVRKFFTSPYRKYPVGNEGVSNGADSVYLAGQLRVKIRNARTRFAEGDVCGVICGVNPQKTDFLLGGLTARPT